MRQIGRGRIPLTTKEVAETVRCPVCREAAYYQCHFAPEERMTRPARDYEHSYHHDRLRAAERLSDADVLKAIRNDIRSHARHLFMSFWELAVAVANKLP